MSHETKVSGGRFRLEPGDIAQLDALGISRQEAERQGRLLTSPPPPIRLVRPCRPGDGIERIAEARRTDLARRFQEAASAGRASVFVPASGAATRMFKTVVEASQGRDSAIEKVDSVLLPELDQLAITEEIAASGLDLATASRDQILHVILDPEGMATAFRPKGLVPFHKTPEGARTAFEEHLAEAVLYLSDDDGLCRFDFTIPEHAQEAFRQALELAQSRMGEQELEVRFSIQGHETDTLAVDDDLAAFRLEDGRLLLRPGGHGSLLINLANSGRDIVFVKNIDNIQPAHRRSLVVAWKTILGGRLLELEDKIRTLRPLLDEGYDDPALLDEAVALCRELNRDPGNSEGDPRTMARKLKEHLDRPLRVCGMVRNEGEPGGGPFWVRLGDRVTPQIVEAAQVDLSDEEQARLWAGSTHFNPVDLVLSLRDLEGRPWNLSAYRDDESVFLPRKSHGGRALTALEHPGLWNGSMAHWNTVFVEVPSATFAPVKTIFDLLRDEHRA